jgi:hypothetical protein
MVRNSALGGSTRAESSKIVFGRPAGLGDNPDFLRGWRQSEGIAEVAMSESIEAVKSAPLDLIREKARIELRPAQQTCWCEIPWRPSTRTFDSDRAPEALKKFALILFNRAEEVLLHESDYEVFKSELDPTAANVVAELEQEWRTFSPGSLEDGVRKDRIERIREVSS